MTFTVIENDNNSILHFARDEQKYNSFALPFSGLKYSIRVVNTAIKTLTVPSNKPVWIAVFSYEAGSEFVISVGGSTGPILPTFTDSHTAINPEQIEVKAGDVIEAYSLNPAASMGVSLYAIQ